MGVSPSKCLPLLSILEMITVLAARFHDQLLKSSTKLDIENRVNDGVEEAVAVADPCSKCKGKHRRLPVVREFQTERVHDVAGEKRHPAEQKNT